MDVPAGRTATRHLCEERFRIADHATIYLQVWHRVVQNTEVRPSPVEDEPDPDGRMSTEIAGCGEPTRATARLMVSVV